MRELIRGASFAFILKVISAALSFAFALLLGRYAGAEGVGKYYLVLSIIVLGSVVGRLGTDISLLRFTAAHAVGKGYSHIKGAYTHALGITFLGSLIVTIIIFSGADILANKVFSNPDLTPLIRIGAFAIIPFSISLVYAEALKGLKSILFHMIYLPHAGIIVTPFLILALLIIPDISIRTLIVFFIGANLITMLAGSITWHLKLPQIKKTKGDFKRSKLLKSSLPLFILGLMFIIMEWSATFILEIVKGSKEVGIYNVAYRIAAPMTFILTALNVFIAPRFSEFFHSGKLQEINTTLKNAIKLALVTGTPILLIIILFPEFLLSLFGSEFTAGSTALMILAVGQFFNILTGTIPQLLMMSGNENYAMINTISGSMLCLILNIILIPAFGINGAAVATVSGMALINILSWIQVRHKLKLKFTV